MTGSVDPDKIIRPIYRGAARPELGVRRVVGAAAQFDFSIDGGPDDIIGYESQDRSERVIFRAHVH